MKGLRIFKSCLISTSLTFGFAANEACEEGVSSPSLTPCSLFPPGLVTPSRTTQTYTRITRRSPLGMPNMWESTNMSISPSTGISWGPCLTSIITFKSIPLHSVSPDNLSCLRLILLESQIFFEV